MRKGVELLVIDEITVDGSGTVLKKSFDGPHDEMIKSFLININPRALEFMEASMRDERGRGNPKLENIQSCLEAILEL